MNQNTPQSDSATAIRVSPATAGSFVLLVSFFLPWIKFLGGTAAGFELHKIWTAGPYLWVIPVAAVAAILVGLFGGRNVEIGQVAGGTPLVFLAVALYQFGPDLFKGLEFGGFLTLITGLFLLSVVPRISPKAESSVASREASNP